MFKSIYMEMGVCYIVEGRRAGLSGIIAFGLQFFSERQRGEISRGRVCAIISHRVDILRERLFEIKSAHCVQAGIKCKPQKMYDTLCLPVMSLEQWLHPYTTRMVWALTAASLLCS